MYCWCWWQKMVTGSSPNILSPPLWSAVIHQVATVNCLLPSFFQSPIKSGGERWVNIICFFACFPCNFLSSILCSNFPGCSLKAKKILFSSHLNYFKIAPDNSQPNEFPQRFLSLFSFINFSIQFYLLNIYHKPDIVLRTGETTPNKARVIILLELSF